MMTKKKQFKKQKFVVQKTSAPKEEYAIVLDFLPNGYPSESRQGQVSTPIVQALGKEYLTLLELVPKEGVEVQIGEEVYIGTGKRDKIHHIKGKLSPAKLIPEAKRKLKYAIYKIVKENEKPFVDFFNKAPPLTHCMHQLQLIPGISEQRLWEILEERKEKPFESFADMNNRLYLMQDPEKAITERIIMEFGDQKYYLFVGKVTMPHNNKGSEDTKVFHIKNTSELKKPDALESAATKRKFRSLSKTLPEIGTLRSYGYSTRKANSERYSALEDAIEKEGLNKVISSIEFNKKMKEAAGQTNASETYESDLIWIYAHYGDKYARTPIR